MMADGQGCPVLIEAASEAGITGQPQPGPRRRFSLFRFSVRGLLGLILVVGCGLGWIGRVIKTGDAQRRAVAAINQAGGWVMYDTEWDEGQNTSTWKPRWPKGLVDQVGVDYLGNVVFINLHDRGNDAVLAHVAKFGHLRQLHRPGFAVTDTGLAHLGGLRDLQLLSLEGSQVTDAGLVQLKGLSGLKWLKLTGTKVTDAGVREVQKALPRLRAIR